MAKSCNIFQYENQYINLFLNFPRSPIFHSSVFSTLPIFHILYYPSSSFSALSIFHTPRFPYSLFPHSYFPRFHFPHSLFSTLHIFFTLLIFHTLKFQICFLSTLSCLPVRRAKLFMWRKVVPPAWVNLSTEVRQLVHPSSGCLAPRDNFRSFI